MSTENTLPKGWIFLGDGWAVSTSNNNDPNYDKAIQCARGRYQRNLVGGYESMSGSTLKGKAKDWSGKYNQSRQTLLKRFKQHGVDFSVLRMGKRQVLVIGVWSMTENPLPVPKVPHYITTSVDDLLLQTVV